MNLLVRTDASTQIGTGHVMRCLALAQAWQEAGGTAQFVLAEATPQLEARLSDEGMEVFCLDVSPGSASDASQTVDLAQERGAAWLVVDGYHFGAAYQQAIKAARLSLLLVDDFGHAGHYYADLVLNQNISAAASLYARSEPHTRLLLGTRYVLLRREFWHWRGWQRDISPVARKVLVTLGGSDPDNVTLRVIQALERVELNDLEAVVVVGGSNPHLESLRSWATALPFVVRLVQNASNMPELMAWADLAVSAGGSTCWELAFMGLPNVIVILAENQRAIGNGLHTHGASVNLGWHGDLSVAELSGVLKRLSRVEDQRAGMLRAGQSLVDGWGGQHVVAELTHGRGDLNANSLPRE